MSPDEQSFSHELQAWLESDHDKTLGTLITVFAEKAFAVTIMMLMFLPALPLPTGGISHVFEAIVVVIAAQMVLGRRTVWLPERWEGRELGALTTEKGIPGMLKVIRRFERISRPRGADLLQRAASIRILGLVLIGLALAAGLAPPFSGLDTLPAMGAVVVTLGMILGDVAVVGIGVAIGAGGALIIVTLGAAAVRLVTGLF